MPTSPQPTDFDELIPCIVSTLLHQLKYIGLLFSDTLRLSEESTRLQHFCAVLQHAITLCGEEKFRGQLAGLPVFYNPSRWTSERLCGYIGSDLDVAANSVLRSYLEYWLISARQPEMAVRHLVKCLVWYYENRERDIEASLRFFLDLHRAGFISHAVVFRESLSLFWRYCDGGSTSPGLKGATCRDFDRINAQVGAAFKSFKEGPPKPFRDDAFLSVLLDQTMSHIALARESANLDEWLIHQVQLMNPTSALAAVFHGLRGSGAAATHIAMLSQIEEMQADLTASLGVTRTQAQLGSALEWRPSLLREVYVKYKRVYRRKSDALDRYTADRLQFPNAVRDRLKDVRLRKDLDDISIEGWRYYGIVLATPICLAHGLDATTHRSSNLPIESVAKAKGQLGLNADDWHADVKARHWLRQQERSLIADMVITMQGSLEDRALLDKMKKLYPWNANLHRMTGIIHGLRGQSAAAMQSLLSAVLLDPCDQLNWAAVARFMKVNGARDAAARGYAMARCSSILTAQTQ